jgi:hypothetical protein
MMKTITINLAIQQDEKESAFLVKAVKAALQAFRKTYNEERQRYENTPSSEAIGFSLPSSFHTQSLTADSEAGDEPIKTDRTR